MPGKGDFLHRGSKTRRNCLKCDKPFVSIGSHNRVCPGCKGKSDWKDGVSGIPAQPAIAPRKGQT